MSQDLPTHLPPQGQPSLPDITLQIKYLLPDVTWSTLGSGHLPITVSLSSHAPPSPRKAHSYTNFHKAEWEGLTAESERRFAKAPLPNSCSAGEKISGISPATPEDTTSPAVMFGIIAVLSPILCDPSALREISAASMTPSTHEAQHQWRTLLAGVLRPCHQVLMVSSAQARQKEVESSTKHLYRIRVKKALQLEGYRTSLQQAVHCLFHQTRSGTQKAHKRPTPCGPLMQAIWRDMPRSGHKEGALFQSPRSLTGLSKLHLRHLGEHGLAFMTELFNLSVAGVDILTIWKNSVIIPILKAVKRRGLGHSYRPISLLCPAVKIWSGSSSRPSWGYWLHAPPSTVSNLGTQPPLHCSPFLLGLFLASTCLTPLQNKSHSYRHLEAFDTVSHRLLIEMI